jgi:hypothetical protein
MALTAALPSNEGEEATVSDSLKGLFGGGSDRDKDGDNAQMRDFVDRYTTGDPSEGYSREEAAERFSEVLRRASPEQLQRAAQRTVENLPENQRAAFGQMLEQRKSGQGLVDIQRTGGTAPSSGAASGTDDPLGGLLGGLLGGGAAGGAAGGLDDLLGGLTGGQSGGGGGLGGMLGGLLGGGDDQAQSGATDSGNDPLGGLGDLLSSPMGKAVIGGIAAFAMKEMMDGK